MTEAPTTIERAYRARLSPNRAQERMLRRLKYPEEWGKSRAGRAHKRIGGSADPPGSSNRELVYRPQSGLTPTRQDGTGKAGCGMRLRLDYGAEIPPGTDSRRAGVGPRSHRPAKVA